MKLFRRYYISIFVASTVAVFILASAGTVSADNLEQLKRSYYLAEEIERPDVLENIRSIGTDQALAFTFNLLRYPDVRVRLEAAASIRSWGPEGYDAAFSGLEDPEISWMCESIFADLGPAATGYLLKKLNSRLPSVRARAAYVLGITEDPTAVEKLLASLKDPSREVRIQAIQALSGIQSEESLPKLLELFEEDDVELSEYILLAVERFGWRALGVLELSLDSKSETLRAGAAMGLGRIKLPETIPLLLDALGDPSPMVRASAVRSLGQIKDMRAASGIVSALGDTDREVQDYASSALAGFVPDIVPVLIKELGSKDPVVRRNVISALRKTADKRALWSIIQMLNDPDRTVRMYAVTALIQFKDPSTIGTMIERLKKEKEIQWLISYAFMELGADAADELLASMGDEEFCYTRNLIVLRMGDKALDVLHRRAASGDTTKRMNAIAILGEMNNTASLPVLGGLLGDDDVGWVAASALGEMGRPGWDTLRNNVRKTGLMRTNALNGISMVENRALLGNMVSCLSEKDPQLRHAVLEPLVRSGKDGLEAMLDVLEHLPSEGFHTAVDIICRIDDPEAGSLLEPLLFPMPGSVPSIGKGRSYLLRQAYGRSGSLETFKNRLSKELTGAAGGSEWQRVAP